MFTPSQFPSPYSPLSNRYYAVKSTTSLTVQQAGTATAPAQGTAQILLEQAVIYAATAVTATLLWGGTAASATSLTIVNAPNINRAPVATAWYGSNASGQKSGPEYGVLAGDSLVIDLSLFIIGNAGGVFTITTSGTATIAIQWREEQP
jgi:hypothetical protein